MNGKEVYISVKFSEIVLFYPFNPKFSEDG